MSNDNYKYDWTVLAEGLIDIIGVLIFFILTVGILSTLYKSSHTIASKPSLVSKIAVFLTLTVFPTGVTLSFIAKTINPPEKPAKFMFYFVFFIHIALFITTILDFYVLLKL